ncbi:MAG: nickel pincer cofactor biosynthesis protein LarC [Longimicrobiales bacterium]
MRALIFDPFAGISGDMVLGALVDLGLPAPWLRDFVAGLRLGDVAIHIDRADRGGIACGRVSFALPEQHVHRRLHDILEIIDGAAVTPTTRNRAALIFGKLAEAEAGVHGVSIEEVHFHEVGALDAILDVLCAVAAVEQLGFEHFFTRPVALGRGWIDIAHGRFPVPAPATVALLKGLPVSETPLQGECTTPTGAAILAGLVERPAPPGAFVLRGGGYGAGGRDPKDRPNCLRVLAAEVSEDVAPLYMVQADIDDLSPEYVPPAQDAVLEAGALDAIVAPVSMKKGRPGLRFEALVPGGRLDDVIAALFRSTTTIGARYWSVQRPALARSEDTVRWRGQLIRRKHVRLPDGDTRSKLEYEDVSRVAGLLGLPAEEVRRAVEREADTTVES